MPLTFNQTDSTNPEFIALVYLLDADLRVRDGEDHAFFAQFNKIDQIRQVVVAYENGYAVGCGALKAYALSIGEVKRMFVRPEYRGQGIAGLILQQLETWAIELHFSSLVLETGKAQPEAIRLYTKSNYTVIPNYGQYKDVASSVCMQKEIGVAAT